MASTLKKFLPPGWDDVADGEVIIKSASGVVGGSMSATVGAESITNAEISPTAAIDVSKLANGSVSNAEFQYLDGVSSAIQTQLNGKQASILGTGPSGDGVEFASKVLLHGTEGVVGSNYITGDELFQLNGVTSNIQTQLNNTTNKQPQSIRVAHAYAATTPTKVSGHANLGVAAFPGDSQFRITHSQGNTNFAVQVTRYASILSNGSYPELITSNISIPQVLVTSTYIDVWFPRADVAGFQIIDVEFFLTLFPY